MLRNLQVAAFNLQ